MVMKIFSIAPHLVIALNPFAYRYCDSCRSDNFRKEALKKEAKN